MNERYEIAAQNDGAFVITNLNGHRFIVDENCVDIRSRAMRQLLADLAERDARIASLKAELGDALEDHGKIANKMFEERVAKERAEADIAERDAVIAACAHAVGASVTADCSAEFRAMLPDEIRMRISRHDDELAQNRFRLRERDARIAELIADRDEARNLYQVRNAESHQHELAALARAERAESELAREVEAAFREGWGFGELADDEGQQVGWRQSDARKRLEKV